MNRSRREALSTIRLTAVGIVSVLFISSILFLSIRYYGPTPNSTRPSIETSISSSYFGGLNPPFHTVMNFGGLNSPQVNVSKDETISYHDFFNYISDGSRVYATADKFSSSRNGTTSATYLLALGLPNGNLLWERKLSNTGAKGSGLDFAGNNTMAVEVPEFLSLVDNHGNIKWSIHDSNLLGFPIVSDSKIYTNIGVFFSADGRKSCSFAGGMIQAIGGGKVFFMHGNTTKSLVTAIDATTCKETWTAALGPKPGSWASWWPVYSRGLVFASDQTDLYSFDSQDGKIIWDVKHGMTNFWPPVVGPSRVFLTGLVAQSGASEVSAFDSADGHLLWRSTTLEGDALRPVLNGEDLIVASGCTISILNASDGSSTWNDREPDCKQFWYAYYGPIVSGSYIILSDDVSTLLALKGKMGAW